MTEKEVIDMMSARFDDLKDYMGQNFKAVMKTQERMTNDIENIKIANARQDEEIKGIHNRIGRIESQFDNHLANHKYTNINIKFKAFFGSKKGKLATLLGIAAGILVYIVR